MTDQERHEQQVRDAAATNGHARAGSLADGTELALVGRITVLEEWRERIEPAFGLLCIAVMAGALAALTTALLLRKRMSS